MTTPRFRGASNGREQMLVDQRTYTVKPGTMAKQMALYQEYGLVPQKRHLGEPLAYLITESGEVNTFVHMWVYQDAADRAARRAAMGADPEWQVYLQKNAEAGYLVKQKNNLMTPAPFAPIKR
jgi:NIPSNAP protein